ncbi:hypothetical protein K456DRAFT_52791 [Colletotrichum gloeosporioides 23]|nr:hypothetical protein K456DRAFT_52791 [Colletotrichum gloeosporioides 23]
MTVATSGRCAWFCGACFVVGHISSHVSHVDATLSSLHMDIFKPSCRSTASLVVRLMPQAVASPENWSTRNRETAELLGILAMLASGSVAREAYLTRGTFVLSLVLALYSSLNNASCVLEACFSGPKWAASFRHCRYPSRPLQDGLDISNY